MNFENCLKTPKFAAMTTDEILALIKADDNSDLAQVVRTDLLAGGGQLLGLDIYDGYVTTIITQPKDASTAPFEIENDTYSMDGPYGPTHRSIEIRRNSLRAPTPDPNLEKPIWPDPMRTKTADAWLERSYQEAIHSGRGGARPGSGRKPIKDEDRKRNVTVSFRVNAATRDALQGLRAQGIDINAELEKLVARLTKRDTKG